MSSGMGEVVSFISHSERYSHGWQYSRAPALHIEERPKGRVLREAQNTCSGTFLPLWMTERPGRGRGTGCQISERFQTVLAAGPPAALT